MQHQVIPVENTIEQATFNLTALASRDGPILELKDWHGGNLPQFNDARKSGWPLLDLVILAPGHANVVIRLSSDAAVFADWFVMGVIGGAWGDLTLRIPARFARVQVKDTSNAANNGIYLWTRLASQ